MAPRMRCELPSWHDVYELARALAFRIHDDAYRPDLIVAIGRGGYTPGRLLADFLHLEELTSFRVQHYTSGADRQGQARVVGGLVEDLGGRRVLVADDVNDSGDTLAAAVEHVRERGAGAVRTAVLQEKDTTRHPADYVAERVQRWRWIVYPWAVIEDVTGFIRRMDPPPEDPGAAAERLEELYGVRLPERTLRDVFRLMPGEAVVYGEPTESFSAERAASPRPPEPLTLFLGGDVMTGRGVDQVLPHPGEPTLHETWVKDARGYVGLAEETNGPIPAPVDPAYVWGAALAELDRAAPAARIVNLETAVTTSDAFWPGKGIHYRMHPGNAGVLTAAGIDCCALANNHVLDWGRTGLAETLEVLRRAGVAPAGAGRDLREARTPAVLDVSRAGRAGGRVLVVAMAASTSGVPGSWEATEERSGLFLLPDPPERGVPAVREALQRVRRPGDVAVASVHMGGNWGWDVPASQRRLAHALIDEAGVDLVHGHSSHHVKAVEVHAGRLVLYGCGDLLTDYEGIGGRERYRGGLALLYFPALDPATGALRSLEMAPVTTRRFRLERCDRDETRWLADTLSREGEPFGTGVETAPGGRLRLRWASR